ncbi:hypothetical protein KC19_2G115200 [Ceratodon purpureus]|uniref:Cyclic nucleotide-binding domain-containing protein n=1 Tax=Ceratodon purpureus TaxID=3225 RepID=A0A8T0IWN4_CERPU|nr:hypothetical protein KC19_2G115200 [Ceratodon purpureus]
MKTSPRTSRCDSAYSGQIPKGLGAAILRNPDAVFGLVKRRKSKRKSVKASIRKHQSEIIPIVDPNARKTKSASQARRRSSAAAPRRISTSAGGSGSGGAAATKRRSLNAPIGGMGEIRTNEVQDEDRPSKWGSPRGSIEAMAMSGTLDLKDKVTPPFPTGKRDVPHWPFVGGVPQTRGPAGRFSLMQIHFSDVYGEKRPKKNKYSLRLFLQDCHRKEREAKLAEFGDKDHKLWQMGLRGDQKMPGIVGEGNEYYRKKFEKWARNIIDREKKLLSHTEVEGSGETSFMPGVATSEMMKLKKGRGKDGRPQYIPPGHKETSSIIDIGCLKAGDFFGERGLMTASKRAASIVAVTTVETLVLTKWDFHRHCDRQVLKIFKGIRRVVNEVFEGKARRFHVGPRKIRVLPKPNRNKHELPVKEWLFKSQPTVLPSFPNQDPFALMRLTMQN